MKLNLDDFKETLPYASELFGIYQPLLGWRSRIIKQRVDKGRLSGLIEVTSYALSRVKVSAFGVSGEADTSASAGLVTPALQDPPVAWRHSTLRRTSARRQPRARSPAARTGRRSAM